ncbi:Uncharacterised protein [uncultured archaeon]|nr:Uncharacterised protein [uncultured archaeon]
MADDDKEKKSQTKSPVTGDFLDLKQKSFWIISWTMGCIFAFAAIFIDLMVLLKKLFLNEPILLSTVKIWVFEIQGPVLALTGFGFLALLLIIGKPKN